jgi:hypothetical protein
VSGDYVKYSFFAIIVALASGLLWGQFSDNRYAVSSLKVYVVDRAGEPIVGALVVASWQDHCAPHGAFKAVVTAREAFTNDIGEAVLPAWQIKSPHCLSHRQTYVHAYAEGYEFRRKVVSAKEEMSLTGEYRLSYASGVELIGEQCFSNCFIKSLSSINNRLRYWELREDQKKHVPELKKMMDKISFKDRGKL